MNFPSPVHNLGIDAAVEMNGVRVGRVKSIDLGMDGQAATIKTPVTIELEGWRLHMPGFSEDHAPSQAQLDQYLGKLVQKGLRAELASTSLITGQRFVALNISPDAPAAKLGIEDGKAVIPSGGSGSLDDLTRTANTVLTHADRVVQNLAALSGPDELQHTVKTLDGTLVDVDKLLGQLNSTVSPLGRQLPQALGELKDAGRSIRELADYLNQHPEALITGRGENQ